MSAIRAAGARAVLRAGVTGVLVTAVALWVLLRSLLGLLEPRTPGSVLAASGALMVFAAAGAGGAAGAWQAALAGTPTRRAIVHVGAGATAVAGVAASLALAVAESVDPARALLELVAVVAGAGAGAWAFPRAVLAVAALRGDRGQTSAEYLGVLVLVAAVIAAVVAGVPRIGDLVSGTVGSIAVGEDPRGQEQSGAPSGPGAQTLPVGDRVADDDRDGLSTEEERALGTRPDLTDSDRDDVPDGEEYVRGTDPAQGLAPLTTDNASRPWERVGLSEDEWRELEGAVLDEVNPDGVEGFLTGDAAEALTLDENGELTLVPPGAFLYVEDGRLEVAEVQLNGVGGGLVKGVAKLLGGGGARALGPAASSALRRSPAALRSRLGRVGIGPSPRGPLRLPQDVAISPVAPRALGTSRSVGRPSHNQALQRDLAALPRGATNVRVNQQQVNAAGQRVGINRPDLQYTVNGRRYYVEYEGVANARGAIHRARIQANDPNAVFRLRIVP